jgi:hypothetical protein
MIESMRDAAGSTIGIVGVGERKKEEQAPPLMRTDYMRRTRPDESLIRYLAFFLHVAEADLAASSFQPSALTRIARTVSSGRVPVHPLQAESKIRLSTGCPRGVCWSSRGLSLHFLARAVGVFPPLLTSLYLLACACVLTWGDWG